MAKNKKIEDCHCHGACCANMEVESCNHKRCYNCNEKTKPQECCCLYGEHNCNLCHQQKACSGKCNDFNFGHRKDCALSTPTSEPWEEEFKEMFQPLGTMIKYVNINNFVVVDAILGFIRNLLAQQRKSYIEKIKEERPHPCHYDPSDVLDHFQRDINCDKQRAEDDFAIRIIQLLEGEE